MKNLTNITILILLLTALSGCATDTNSIAGTPTAESIDPAVEFLVEIQRAEATAKSIEATQVWIYGQLTATEQIKEERATQQAIIATQQALNMQASATHDAFVVQQAATDRAWYTTQTAAVQGTATAYPLTSTAQSIHQTQTQQAWITTATMDAAYGAAQATAAFGNAQSVQLAVERERSTNMTRAWLPWMGFVAAMGLIVVMGIRWSKVRVIQKDAFGSAPVLVVDGTAMDIDSSTSMRVLKDGSTEWKQGSDLVTERKQKVDMVRAMPAIKDNQQQVLLDTPRQAPRLEVLEEGKLNRALLDDIEDQIIEEE